MHPAALGELEEVVVAVAVDLEDEARRELVDGVVDDLPHEVVEAARPGGPDEHPRPLADRVEALEDGDVLGRVRARLRALRGRFLVVFWHGADGH